MKTFLVFLLVSLSVDFSAFSGEYTRHALAATRSQLHSIQIYADRQTAFLAGG